MTKDLCAELEVSSPKITLEPLDHGSITVHWDDIVEAVDISHQGCSWSTLANAMLAVRQKTLIVWAIWIGEDIQGFCLTQPAKTDYSGARAMFIYALHANDLSLDQWRDDVIPAFKDILRRVGYTKIVAVSSNPRIIEIIKHAGWQDKMLCETEI